jgi:hypothetical protein
MPAISIETVLKEEASAIHGVEIAESGTALYQRPLPDWEAIEKELRGRGVTLRLSWLEYLPGGLPLHPVLRAFSRRAAAGAAADNATGTSRRPLTGEPLPLKEDCGRASLYARFDTDVSADGLGRLGLADIDPGDVPSMDAVQHIDKMHRVGRTYAERYVDMTPFHRFE